MTRVTLAAVATLLVAACGTTVAPGGPGSSTGPASGGVHATGGATDRLPPPTGAVPPTASDGVSSPTTAPAAPAPPAFTDRAAVVAAAVRRAGVPRPPTSPQAYTLAPGLGFETDAQKIAWMAGRIAYGPGIPADQVGSSRLTLADGSTRPVDIVGPRAAVERALDTSRGDCSGIPAADCLITVTTARLTTSTVDTTRGKLTAPVWELTVGGLTHPLHVVAVSADGLPRFVPLVGPPGLPAPEAGIIPADSLTASTSRTVTVTLGHGACDVDLRGHVVELDDLVVVGGTSTPPTPGTACNAMYLLTPTTLTLRRALGERALIDIVSGKALFADLPPVN